MVQPSNTSLVLCALCISAMDSAADLVASNRAEVTAEGEGVMGRDPESYQNGSGAVVGGRGTASGVGWQNVSVPDDEVQGNGVVSESSDLQELKR